MTPMNVDRLFAKQPELFAYRLPTISERGKLKSGDLIKLFFKLDRFQYPRPIWFNVKTSSGVESNTATATLASMAYGEWTRASFPGTIQFGLDHIYRLPVDRPEQANPSFDEATRA